MRRRSAEISDNEESQQMMDYTEDDSLTARPSPRVRKVNWLKMAVVGTIAFLVILFLMAVTSNPGRNNSTGNNLMSPEATGGEHLGPFHAGAVIIVGDTGAKIGSLMLVQETRGGTVKISGEVTGLSPNQKHGFHIHKFGDLSQGCNSVGPHFNPFNATHGAPTDEIRHVGDLGNIETDSTGTANVQIEDSKISLVPGVTSIIGRAVVVHTGEDDLGRGGSPDSLTTGNAGTKYGCGVIGIKP